MLSPGMRGVLCASALAVFCLPALAEQPADWSQEEATRLSKQLTEQVTAIYQGAKIEKRDKEGMIHAQSIENYLLVEDLQQLDRLVRALARRLENGQDFDDTEKLFRRIENVIPRIRIHRQQSVLLQQAQPQIDQARATYTELGRFYGARPLPEPPPVSVRPPEEKR